MKFIKSYKELLEKREDEIIKRIMQQRYDHLVDSFNKIKKSGLDTKSMNIYNTALYQNINIEGAPPYTDEKFWNGVLDYIEKILKAGSFKKFEENFITDTLYHIYRIGLSKLIEKRMKKNTTLYVPIIKKIAGETWFSKIAKSFKNIKDLNEYGLFD